MSPPVTREARRLLQSAKFIYGERGARFLVGDTVDLVSSYVTYPVRSRRFADRTFDLGGRPIHYVRHHYNRAWRNERTVELALAYDYLDRNRGKRLLEVGNVLSHYRPDVNHDVLDKYERSPEVMNEDIVDFMPDVPYEAVLSISTLEHVGWDERPRDPDKVLRAYEQLRKIVAPEGTMLLTCPIGQNPHLDRYIAEGRIDFPERHYLRRVSKDNEWREVGLDDVRGARYHQPYRNANAVFVGIVPPA